MHEQPQTWHYGLMARWWAEFNGEPDADELAFYQRVIEQNGQPALDLACGAGRILIPLLRAGLAVDGCDVSPDMLAHCRAKAVQEGLSPVLYNQAMHELALPRTYRTIFICDSFGIGGQRSQDLAGLRAIYRHLEPGGALVFNHYLPYDDPQHWALWLPERRAELPQPWPESRERRQTANGDELELSTRIYDLDPLAQRLTRQMRAALWQAGQKVAEEEHILYENLYFYPELLAMLTQAGFSEIEVFNGYSEQPMAAKQTIPVFVARKVS